MRKKTTAVAMLISGVLLLCGVGAEAGGGHGRFLSMRNGGDGYGADINFIVREVKVTPIRAHVGDVITVEMVIENHGDIYQGSARAEIYANRKVVANSLFTYGDGGDGGRIRKAAFRWDTRGVAPGEYRIRGELFLFTDSSPFDNELTVKEPLVLLHAGAAFPAGQETGGTAVARDPRWKPRAEMAGEGGAPANEIPRY